MAHCRLSMADLGISRGTPMLDIVFIAAGLGSLAVCLGYVLICDRL
jgi:hypothetical protein